MPISKPWLSYEGLAASKLPGTVGAYELGDADGDVIYIGYAGGRSLFGIRGALTGHGAESEPNPVIRERVRGCRYEVTTNYLLRHLELLSQFHEAHGRIPAANEVSGESLPPLSRYRWSPGGSDPPLA